MDFAASASSSAASPKHTKHNNKRNNNKKKNRNKKASHRAGQEEEQDTTQMMSTADELSAFLFMLDMSEDNNDTQHTTSTSLWTADEDLETQMSANYIAAHDRSSLESEFLSQFRTHLAWKQYLSGPARRRFKDRVFLLLAKEKEAEAAQTAETSSRVILLGHFLYEELRLQHEFFTTPQVTDTPNDTAFKATMVSVICGLIRNCNQSRTSVCLDVKDDEDESEALFHVPMAPPGSCLHSILRPLYCELLSRQSESGSPGGDSSGEQGGDDDISKASSAERFRRILPQLHASCCSSATGNDDNANSNSANSSSLFFEGPPEWHCNLPFFMKRVQYSQPSAETMGFIKHALRQAQQRRVLQDHDKFYDLAYGHGRAHRQAASSGGAADSDVEGFASLPLPFHAHVMLHRACHAVVALKPGRSPPAGCEAITLGEFKRLVTVAAAWPDRVSLQPLRDSMRWRVCLWGQLLQRTVPPGFRVFPLC